MFTFEATRMTRRTIDTDNASIEHGQDGTGGETETHVRKDGIDN